MIIRRPYPVFAPETGAGAAANEPPPPPPFTDAPITDSDEAERRLTALLSGEDAPPKAAPPTPSEAAPAEDAAPAEEQAPGDEQEVDPQPEEAAPIDPPRSWSKEAREKWSSLPRDVQEYVLARETDRDLEVRRGQNEAAEIRKAAEAERQALALERQQWQQTIAPALQNALGGLQAHPFAQLTPEQRVQLRQTDPAGFINLRDDFEMKQAEAQKLWHATQELQRRQAAEFETRFNAVRQEQERLLAEKWPELVSETTGPALKQQARDYLKGVGFSDQEVSQLVDHRLALVLRDAIRGREAAAKAKIAQAKVAKAPPVTRPGAAPDRDGVSYQKRTALRQQLATSNDTDAQARILEQFL